MRWILFVLVLTIRAGAAEQVPAAPGSLADMLANYERQENEKAFAPGELSTETVLLLKTLMPFSAGGQLINPSTKQTLSMPAVRSLLDQLRALVEYNQKLTVQIQNLMMSVLGSRGKSIVREVQLAVSLVVVGGVRAGVGLALEDNADSTRITVGLNMYTHWGNDDGCGAFIGTELAFEQFTCDQNRLTATEGRTGSVFAFPIGRTRYENGRSSSGNHFGDLSATGLSLGLGASFPFNSSYSRVAIPIFWMPLGWASGIHRLIKKQHKVLESISSFQLAKAFDQSQELEQRILRLYRRAQDRGFQIQRQSSKPEGGSPFSSVSSMLEFVLEQQSGKTCDQLLSKSGWRLGS